MEGFDLDKFIDSPSVQALSGRVKKDDWVQLAKAYNIIIRSSWKKEDIKKTVLKFFVDKTILDKDAMNLCEQSAMSEDIRRLELEIEREKMKDREKERDFQREMLDRRSKLPVESHFDVTKVVKFVPRFVENDPEEFFLQFENVATCLEWPVKFWPVLVQSALVGKGRSSYLSLTADQQKDYDVVKDFVLISYKLTPEFYRNKFRNVVKEPNQTYIEYSHSLSKLSTRWLSASKVSTFDELKELLVLEQYMLGVPVDVRKYLLEREVDTIERAASLSENFSLINQSKSNFQEKKVFPAGTHKFGGKPGDHKTDVANKPSTHVSKNVQPSQGGGQSQGKSIGPCYYCKGFGHLIGNCPKLAGKSKIEKPVANLNVVPAELIQPVGNCPKVVGKSKTEKPVANINVIPAEMTQPVCVREVKVKDEDLDASFAPFCFDGLVSVSKTSPPVSVSILRDTGAAQSVLIKSAVPFLDECYTGDFVVLNGVGGTVTVPLCQMFLKTDLLAKPVIVAIKEQLPVDGVTFLMGNDIAGNLVVPDPVVCSKPLEVDPMAELVKHDPDLFPVCAVTRSQSKKILKVNSDEPAHSREKEGDFEYNLCGLFSESNVKEANIDKCGVDSSGGKDLNNVPVTRQMLITQQNSDNSLSPLLQKAVTEAESESEPRCYYVKGGVLMRKFRPPDVPSSESWNVIHQIVVPLCYRDMVLSIAHDHLGGHLGVRKTTDKVLRYFYWPGVSSDVANYCKTCHICQLTGKPNQVIPTAPLQPIPVVGEPFSNVQIDCVGPLSKTKSGKQYLLTIMCTSTRYPEAIPLGSIKAKSIIPHLIKFFTQFGFPCNVQSDQGSNFTSKILGEVLKSLKIKHYLSTAYHPESQGALERSHATLKSVLTKFCMEYEKDWDIGLPLVLYAMRSTKQESLGYSPNELLFGKDTRGPMRLLFESWVEDEKSEELSVYVKKLRSKLVQVREFALKNLERAQVKMKLTHDKKSVARDFATGEKVLLFLPVRKSPLQARFQGPYKVIRKEGKVNYLISTPGRRKTKRLVHVNLLKPYFERNVKPVCAVECVSELTGSEDIDGTDHVNDFDVGQADPKMKNSDILSDLSAKLGHLSAEDQALIASLLVEFPDIMSDVPTRSHVVEHDIVLVEGASCVRQAPYRVSPHKRELMRKEVQYLLENGLAEPSVSEWASACILVPKPDRAVRLCTDYRLVNIQTRPDSFPLARIDDLIDSVGKSSILTKIDMLKGYYQIPLTENAKKISAFVTPDGLYQYTVMSFGLRNAPCTYQRAVAHVIREIKGVGAYLDDILVCSDSMEEHVSQLKLLFQRIREAGFTINLCKSDFVHAQVTYLGHVVGRGQVAPINAKVEAIADLPAPKGRKAVQRFLGMAGYYRRYCPNFAGVVSPLTKLVSPKQPFVWSDQCQAAFDNVKSMLMSKPILKSPDFNVPFELQIDASDVAAGAVLLQRVDDVLHPVCYLSTKFKPYQCNYSTIEKEALSLLIALEKLEIYFGNTDQEIVVYSDHNPLQFVNKMKNKNQRLTRWSLALQPFNICIKHIKGRDNVIADALSRPVEF